MRKHPRTCAEIGDIHIDQAAHPRTRGIGLSVELDALHVPRVRDVPLPEPVDTEWINGRPPGGWETCFPFCELPPVGAGFEEAAIREARERERRAELVLLAGTGQP